MINNVRDASMFRALDDPGFLALAVRLDHAVLSAPAGKQFWTTSHPVLVDQGPGRPRSILIATMALNPSKLLILYPPGFPQWREMGADLVGAHNLMLVQRPWRRRRWVFSKSEVHPTLHSVSKEDLTPLLVDCEKHHDIRCRNRKES